MKKVKILIITLFIFLFGLNSVNAMTLKPTGATSGKRGSTVTLYVTLNRSNEEKTISAVDGTLTFDSNILELQESSNLMTGWTQFSNVSNGKQFGYGNLSFDNLITTTSQNIVKMVFKIKNDASYGNTTIKVSNTSATDDKGDAVTISGGNHTLKVLSDVNTLTGITLSNGTIEFSENKTEYNLTIDSESTNISVTKKDSNSTTSGDIGNKTLKYGNNTFKITVKSESGIDKVYTLNITRPDNRSKVNTLSSLKTSEGTIKFNKDTLNYNLTVKSNIEKIKVEATLTDNKSKFVSGYGPRTVNLKLGKNTIEVRVMAENESVKTYKINVTREDARSSNNYLSNLSLSEGNIQFDKETLEYETTVLYKVEKIEVTAETEDKKAKYEVTGNEELKVGENIITIKVTAENETVKEYKIKVIRKEEAEELSSNSNLSSLNIEGYQLNFSSNQYEYNLEIGEEISLNITYEKEDEKSTVTIHGNENLQNNSLIRVKVTAEDGSETEYKIRIKKEEKSNLIYFVIGGIIILIIAIIIVILMKNKKKPSNQTLENNVNQNSIYPNNIPVNGINQSNIPVNSNVQNNQTQQDWSMDNNQRIQEIQNLQYSGVLSNQQQMQQNQNNIQNNQVNNQNNFNQPY